jgi:hypothetical protein
LSDNLAKTKEIAQLKRQKTALSEQLDMLWGRKDGVAGGAVRQADGATRSIQDKSITPLGGHARVELTLDEDFNSVVGQSQQQAEGFREALAAHVCAALALGNEERGRLRITDLHPGSVVATVEIAPGAPGKPPADMLAQALAGQAADATSPLRQRVPTAVGARVLPAPAGYGATGNAPSGGVFETGGDLVEGRGSRGNE